MKARLISALVVCVALFGLSFSTGHKTLEIGQTSPAFAELTTGIDGRDAVLREYVDARGIMVIFTSNTCPFVKAWEDRYFTLANYCKANNFGFVLVNSNEAKRDGDESFVAMKNHAKEKGYDFPYVMDHNATIANAFGATSTPHVYLFNNNLELVYRGAIDDNFKDESKVTNTYALNALRNMVAGVEPFPATTEALGCSIKRKK